jgi:SOS-response transcriptional repressor LexA
MHPTQRKLVKLAETTELAGMSLRKIGGYIGESNAQNIKYHLNQLSTKGYLQSESSWGKKKNSPKSITVEVPLLGEVNCGDARKIASAWEGKYIKISKKILKKQKGVYALKAVGNSMNLARIDNQSIDDGDFIIVDGEYTSPINGDYIISIIDGAANVKRFYLDERNQQIKLDPESSDESCQPIFLHVSDLDSYWVSGKVIQVIKS